jgi:ankyrin repeat protein
MKRFIFFFFLLVSYCGFAGETNEKQSWHDNFFNRLHNRMYCISEVGGKIERYDAALEDFRKLLLTNLDSGLDPNEPDEYGMTPLIMAAYLGYPQLVEELLKRKDVKIDLMDKEGLSALDYAMEASRLSGLFFEPMLINNMFIVTPYVVMLSYYMHKNAKGLTPYVQCINLLKSHGAASNLIAFKERMANRIKKSIEFFNQSLTIGEHDDKKEEIKEAILQLQKNLVHLQGYQENSDFGLFCAQVSLAYLQSRQKDSLLP